MPFQSASVEKEYEKDTNIKKEDVAILREWAEKQPHLPKPTELQAILFLQSCYYRLEPAKTAMDNFFTVRTLCPDIFTPLTEDAIAHTLSVGFIKVLPKLTPEGYMVVSTGLVDTRPENYIYINHVKMVEMVLSLHLNQFGACKGLVVLFDMKGSVFGHMARINLGVLKRYIYYLEEANPVRIKGIHLINLAPFTDKLMGLVKPFLKKELVEMLFLHADSVESLFKHIPKEIMPLEYGGGAASMSTLNSETMKNLSENMAYFKWLDTLKVDETKRQGKPKNAGEIFGVDGTFKKLDFD